MKTQKYGKLLTCWDLVTKAAEILEAESEDFLADMAAAEIRKYEGIDFFNEVDTIIQNCGLDRPKYDLYLVVISDMQINKHFKRSESKSEYQNRLRAGLHQHIVDIKNL